jgi:hypothetical protein
MRCSIQEYTNGMKSRQGCEVKRIVTLASQVYVNLVENAVSEIGLLIQRTLDWVALALREERQECV